MGQSREAMATGLASYACKTAAIGLRPLARDHDESCKLALATKPLKLPESFAE
jgi:hypothetical protein